MSEQRYFNITGWEGGITFIPNTWSPEELGGSFLSVSTPWFSGSLIAINYNLIIKSFEGDFLYLRQFFKEAE